MMKKRVLTVLLSALFILSSFIIASAHASDKFNYGNYWSGNPFNHFNACYQWSEFSCNEQKHHATAVIVKGTVNDTVKVTKNAGYLAHAQTDWHYDPDQWNSYYGHD